MAITFRTIGFPEHIFLVREDSFALENRQVSSESVLSRFIRVSGAIQQLWSGPVEMLTMTRERWQEWESFRARLSGQAVLFKMRVPRRRLPLGAGAGFAPTNAPIVITGTTITGTQILEGGTTALVAQAADRYATCIRLEGLVPDALVLTHGDLFGLGGNLYMVVGKVTADANGEARVPFRWRLWKAAKPGDIVYLREPMVRVQLKTADDGRPTHNLHGYAQAAMEVVEVPFV